MNVPTTPPRPSSSAASTRQVHLGSVPAAASRDGLWHSGLCLVLLVLGSACISEGPIDGPGASFQSEELVIGGPWNPPAGTRATAAAQYVPVVDPPAVAPGGSCSSSNPFECSCRHPACTPALPGTVDLDAYLRGRFPGLTSGGLYCCRQNSARTSVPKLSVHAVGRAIDLMVTLEGGDADNGIGDPVANWLVANAEFIGIQRVIWDRGFWNGERGFGLLSSSSSPHTNHLHIELSPDGAARRTPFFTSGASTGVCTARCEGSRIIQADCSTGDCAFYGATCIPGSPPACGVPAPPEPDESAAVPGGTPRVVTTVGPAARFSFVPPRRAFDTRQAALSADLVRGGGGTSGPLPATTSSVYRPGSAVPPGATALWLNMTAVRGSAPGYLTVFPAGASRPGTSNVNYRVGEVRANAAPVALGDGGGVSIYSHSEVHGLADLTGAFTPTGDGLTAVPPRRVFDSRSTDRPLAAGVTQEIDVSAPAGATGVVATVTVIGGASPGHVQAYACGSPVPPTSNINYGPGAVVANTVLSPLGGGKLCLRAHSEAHLIVDVTGYLSPDAPLSYQPLAPQRFLDTRDDTSAYTGRLGRGQVIELPVQGLRGMPDGVWAVVANVTATGATEAGFVTAFPCGGEPPTASSLNFRPGGATAALTVTALGADGSLCLYARSRAHLIVDVLGVWVHDESLIPPPGDVTPDPGDMGEDEPESPGGEDGDIHDPALDSDGGVDPMDEWPAREPLTPGGCSVAVHPGASSGPLALGLLTLLVCGRLRSRQRR